MLERADLPLRTVEFVYLMLGAGLFGGLIAAGMTRSVPLIALGLLGGAALPYLFVSFKSKQRVRAFENQLPDLLVTMAAGLKAGHSFRQALQSVVDEDQPPASKELKRVLTETRLGRPMDEALADMASSNRLEELRVRDHGRDDSAPGRRQPGRASSTWSPTPSATGSSSPRRSRA